MRFKTAGAQLTSLLLSRCTTTTTTTAAVALETKTHYHSSSLNQQNHGADEKKKRINDESKRIAVGISGGVDSAVAAMLLKNAGHDVIGVFMRNWDEAEEIGSDRNCSIQKDLEDATAVCHRLNIPLHEADFVSQYWNDVFTNFLSECGRGLTPNPDLACNRHIKFGALLQFAESLGAVTVATGHYARLQYTSDDADAVQLLKGRDLAKDQSYFLASVHADALRHVLFPIGEFKKTDVKKMAADAGLDFLLERKSSAGICFIGRRNFSNFLSQYLPPLPGEFIDIESGEKLADCSDITSVTFGQRPGIGGASQRTYVAGKDVNTRVVYIATGRDHPALLTRSACLRTPHWLSAAHAERLQRDGVLNCEYKARYGQESKPCVVYALRSAPEFRPSAFCGLHPEDAKIARDFLVVRFPEPAGSITPQQQFVMYDGDVCIGSAAIAMPGKTMFEEGGRR